MFENVHQQQILQIESSNYIQRGISLKQEKENFSCMVFDGYHANLRAKSVTLELGSDQHLDINP